MQICAIAGFDVTRARTRPRILIVEDDIESWNLIQRALQRALPDARIQWASDSASARLALESCPFDAVIADYMLEDENTGWSVLKECRRLQPNARVAMTSAMPIRPPGGEQPCPFLRKPFEPASCAEFMKDLLS